MEIFTVRTPPAPSSFIALSWGTSQGEASSSKRLGALDFKLVFKAPGLRERGEGWRAYVPLPPSHQKGRPKLGAGNWE